MKVVPTAIPEVLILEPRLFEDERGYFSETFHEARFAELTGCALRFVQDNESRSRQGVVRGLHYQLPPYAQGKLVRCVEGAVWDVAVDIRRSSPTFGRWVAVELSAENHRQLWIPEGFAHGFVALTPWARLLYKVTAYYAPAAERSLAWNDPRLAISWPELPIPFIVSAKDRAAPTLDRAELFD